MQCLTNCFDKLEKAGIRPTRQRVALFKLLFANGHRHVSAEALHAEALDQQVKVSLATVYNTLKQMTDAGLLKEITVNSGCTWYDTNTGPHHHFLVEDRCQLIDVDPAALPLDALPALPEGTELSRVEIVLRVRHKD